MLRMFKVLVLFVSLTQHHSGELAAQTVFCNRCTISIDQIAALSSEYIETTPSPFVSVIKTAGGYGVSYVGQAPYLAWFNRRNMFIGGYGRRGAGPGELGRWSVFVGAAGDTVYVSDGSRLHSFVSGVPVATSLFDIPMEAGSIRLGNGKFVVPYALRVGGGTTLLNLVSERGDVHSNMVKVDDPNPAERAIVGPASNGGFWSAPNNSNHATLWRPDGSDLKHLKLERPWFRPWSGGLEGEPFSSPPRPQIVGIREAAGNLLVITLVADANWKPVGKTNAAVRLDALNPDALYDTVIEIVDRTTGRISGLIRSDRRLIFVAGTTDEVSSTSQNQDGDIITEVWRIVVRRQ